MQLPTPNAEKHREVSVRARRLTLMNHNVLDILELRLGPNSIISLAATQAAEDVACFLVSSSFCQPTRALWEEPADAEQHQQRNDLEGDRESPADGGVAVVDEAEAKFEPVGDLMVVSMM